MLFCPECGNKLSGNEVFCNQCGTRVTPEAAPAAAPEIPVDVAEEVAVPVHEETPVSIDIPVDEPTPEFSLEDELLADVAEEPAAQEEQEAPAPVYSTPAAPVQEKTKKKSGKLWKILIPIILVILLAGAAAGVVLLADNNYNQAITCLEEKNYDEALERFNKYFAIWKDSKDHIATLEQLQEDYDEATSLLKKDKYVEAIEILSTLGDYRDSKSLLATEIPYQQANFLIFSAENADEAALSQHPGYEEEKRSEILLYEGAAELLLALGEYEDAPVKYSQCYRKMATLYMNDGMFEEAQACQEFMNEEDAASYIEEYKTYCVDEDALAALAEAVKVREEMEANYADDPYMTDLDLVEAEATILEAYAEEDLMYFDEELKELMAAYMAGLVIEASVIEEDGFFSFSNYSTWYTGNAARYAVIETLIEKCDFLGEDPALQDSFIGRTEYYAAAATVEASLLEQLIGVSAQESEEIGTYLVYTNNTGFDLELVLTNEYCDAEGNTVFYHESDPVVIANGETVNLPFLFPETDEWENWYTNWYYDILF